MDLQGEPSYRESGERGRKCGVGGNTQPVEEQAAVQEEGSNAQYKAVQKLEIRCSQTRKENKDAIKLRDLKSSY